jgi:hypothetical protein
VGTLLTTNIWTQISSAAQLSKRPAQVAVAYFGEKGPSLLPLPKGSSLCVDASIAIVAQGGTSPSALERLQRLRNVDVYSVQYLHAKVFAFDDVAFVGSANVSQNSATTLIEAVIQINNKSEISKIRNFVNSLRITKLNAADLRELSKFYRRPKPLKIISSQRKFSTLLMELTHEQGGGRETQVQPPRGVWENFFGLRSLTGQLPTFSLINERANPNVIVNRKVVRHHHTYTIEITGAGQPLPAILQMRRIGHNKYSYVVHRPGDPTFGNINNQVRSLHNPFWQPGRRWVMV